MGQLPLANLVISVSAETKQAMKQMQDLQRHTKKTEKKVNSKTGIVGVALRGILIASAAIVAVTGVMGIAAVGAIGLFKASSYYPMYSKMWANEATMISNEWVKRHMGVFDRLTGTIEKIRMEYVKNKEQSVSGAIAKVVLGGISDKATGMKTAIITKGMSFLTSISQGFSWVISYIQMWVTYYIMPIYIFIKDIVDFVQNIITTIQNFIDAVWDALSILPGVG